VYGVKGGVKPVLWVKLRAAQNTGGRRSYKVELIGKAITIKEDPYS
jgi:hypothetical protein